MARQGVGSARFVYESTNGDNSLGRLWVYIIQGLMTAFPGLRNANLAIGIFDEDENLVRTVVYGNPSESMKKVMDEEFGPVEEERTPA